MRFEPFPRLTRTLAPALIFASALVVGNAGCFLQHHANTNPLAGVKSNQPDKALFDAAMKDMDKGQYTVARLSLETLLNTYPDSEYLARAKMGIADSWYREGGIEGMAQAEAQYKDFITFFPAMKEASEAQLKIATIHYKQLQKPDRDPTQANRAQAELRTFLLNYPDSPLRPQALQMLRDTQEVLAEREYRIGEFYMERARQGEYPDYRAGQARLEDVMNKFPLYSQGDATLDELAHSYMITASLYEGASKLGNSPQTKDLYLANAKADRAKAVADFDRLVERYPVSPMAEDARKELATLKLPVPKPSEDAIAFNRKEIAGRVVEKHSSGFGMGLPGDVASMLSGHPATEIARADKVGAPSLSEPQAMQADPPPGLDQLIKTTMQATGAIPAGSNGNAALSAVLTAANGGKPVLPGPATPASVDAATAPSGTAPAPLAFQNVPDKSRGADTPQTNTPQAMTGSNENDPNARRAVAPADPSVILTPNEIDLENREQILAAEVHRDVPAPLDQLRKNEKIQQEARDKALAKYKEAAAKAAKKAPGGATPDGIKKPGAVPPAPDAPTAPPKKSFFSRIWPQ